MKFPNFLSYRSASQFPLEKIIAEMIPAFFFISASSIILYRLYQLVAWLMEELLHINPGSEALISGYLLVFFLVASAIICLSITNHEHSIRTNILLIISQSILTYVIGFDVIIILFVLPALALAQKFNTYLDPDDATYDIIKAIFIIILLTLINGSAGIIISTTEIILMSVLLLGLQSSLHKKKLKHLYPHIPTSSQLSPLLVFIVVIFIFTGIITSLTSAVFTPEDTTILLNMYEILIEVFFFLLYPFMKVILFFYEKVYRSARSADPVFSEMSSMPETENQQLLLDDLDPSVPDFLITTVIAIFFIIIVRKLIISLISSNKQKQHRLDYTEEREFIAPDLDLFRLAGSKLRSVISNAKKTDHTNTISNKIRTVYRKTILRLRPEQVFRLPDTAREYANACNDLSRRKQLHELTSIYEKARYGLDANSDDLHNAEDLHKNLCYKKS
ncbi:hypothetical protein [Spirochaeta dissipatitropha]